MDADPRPGRAGAHDDEPVVITRGQLDALWARIDALETRAAPADTPRPPTIPATPDPGPGDGSARPMGRRRALAGLAGAAVAGTAAVVAATAEPVAAALPDPPPPQTQLVLGRTDNTTNAATGLAVTGAATYGIGVTDNGLDTYNGSAALLGHARNQSFGSAVHALAAGSASGLLAESDTGTAVRALGNRGPAGTFTGLRASTTPALIAVNTGVDGVALAVDSINPVQFRNIVLRDPYVAPSASTTGMLRWRLDAQGEGSALWGCTATGNPGTWRKIVGTGTAGAFHLLPTPKRVYDSRPGTTPAQGPKTPLAPAAARTIDLKHASSGVPAGATGVLLTLLLLGAANANGNLTVWATGKAKPTGNTMVWGGPAGRFTAGATSAVDAQARIQVDASHRTDLVIDVVGYYR